MSTLRTEIIEAVRNGEKRADVARRLGVHKAVVSRVCVPVLGREQHTAPIRHDRKRMRELYDSGCNDREIGRQMGCWPATVAQWRACEGLPPIEPSGEAHRHAVSLVEQGASFRKAARATGLSLGAVAGAVYRAKRAERKAR